MPMRFNLRQIEVFRAIMLTGSVSRAAALLNVSQPAVSRLLSYTEQRLDLVLFERIKGRLHPTPEARRLLGEVERVYEGVQRVNALAHDLSGHRHGRLRVACSPSLGQGFLPAAVAQFHARHPDVQISLHTLSPAALLDALLTHAFDVGVAYLAEPRAGLLATRLHENRILAALPAGHPLESRRVVRLAELVAHPVVGYGPDVPLGVLLRTHLERARLTVRPTIEVQQVQVACALVQTGVGSTLVDEFTASGPVWAGVCFRPLDERIEAPLDVLSNALQPLSRPARAFVETLQAMVAPGPARR